MNRFTACLVVFVLLPLSPVLAAERVDIGRFSQQDTTGWQKKQFVDSTEYQIIEHQGRHVLKASSDSGATAFYYEKQVDLTRTPYLNWTWLKQGELNPGNEAEKSGDDFVARVYVVKDGGVLFWRTLALNYVWSFSHSQGDAWDNPFAGSNARMVAIRDSRDKAGQWVTEKRHVRDDFKQLMDKDITEIDGIAIMTDSDNSQQSAEALYGDIFFTAD